MRIWSQPPFTWELSLLLEMSHYSSPDPVESCWLELLAFKTFKFDNWKALPLHLLLSALPSSSKCWKRNKRKQIKKNPTGKKKSYCCFHLSIHSLILLSNLIEWILLKNCDNNVYTMRWLLHSCHRREHSHCTPLSCGSHSPSASSLQRSGPCKALVRMAQMFCLGLSIQQSIKVTSMCPLRDLADL